LSQVRRRRGFSATADALSAPADSQPRITPDAAFCAAPASAGQQGSAINSLLGILSLTTYEFFHIINHCLRPFIKLRHSSNCLPNLPAGNLFTNPPKHVCIPQTSHSPQKTLAPASPIMLRCTKRQ